MKTLIRNFEEYFFYGTIVLYSKSEFIRQLVDATLKSGKTIKKGLGNS